MQRDVWKGGAKGGGCKRVCTGCVCAKGMGVKKKRCAIGGGGGG